MLPGNEVGKCRAAMEGGAGGSSFSYRRLCPIYVSWLLQSWLSWGHGAGDSSCSELWEQGRSREPEHLELA